ncbi:hypothetical protein [Verminephrobacter eiseniae]|uniref:hypothetical protein n=1 Tax=Verminephrobacter eiseniae TaxID=364317 RepID=UPI0022372090|nr:hypothetical protein [Verminephrobacter eiseniae]
MNYTRIARPVQGRAVTAKALQFSGAWHAAKCMTCRTEIQAERIVPIAAGRALINP